MTRSMELALADMQAKIFALSGRRGYASEKFIKLFMKSNAAARLDDSYDRLQWAGANYVMECLEENEDFSGQDMATGKIYDEETLFWMGYTYRLWHFISGKSSREIYRVADAETMYYAFPGYHTFSVELAVEKLEERGKAGKTAL